MDKMVNFNICEGNPGALTFLMDAYTNGNPFEAEVAFRRMQYNKITGAKLYMLWNDCCDRDTKAALDIMSTRSIPDIKRHINYEGGRGIPFESMEKEAKA